MLRLPLWQIRFFACCKPSKILWLSITSRSPLPLINPQLWPKMLLARHCKLSSFVKPRHYLLVVCKCKLLINLVCLLLLRWRRDLPIRVCNSVCPLPSSLPVAKNHHHHIKQWLLCLRQLLMLQLVLLLVNRGVLLLTSRWSATTLSSYFLPSVVNYRTILGKVALLFSHFSHKFVLLLIRKIVLWAAHNHKSLRQINRRQGA